MKLGVFVENEMKIKEKQIGVVEKIMGLEQLGNVWTEEIWKL